MELAHAYNHVWRCFKRKRVKRVYQNMDKRLYRSLGCPHDTSKRGKKRIYCFDYQQETKFSFVRTRFLVLSLFTSNFV